MKPLFTLAVLALPAFAAFPNGYNYCKVVTTSRTMVSGTSDLANYPLTVILTDTDLRTVSNGGLVNNGSGYDIGFYPDCSGSGTALKWEVESYSPTTGAIVAHVLRPTLSHTADDTVGMYYGGSFSSFQSTATAVWVNYAGVWHLGNGLSPADSTANVFTLTNNGFTSTTGQVDGAAHTSYTPGNYMAINGFTYLSSVSQFTISVWAKLDAINNNALFSVINNPGDPTNDILFGVDGSSPPNVFSQVDNGADGGGSFVSSASLLTGGFNHFVLVFDGTQTGNSNRLKMYLNGVLQTLGFGGFTVPATSANLNGYMHQWGRYQVDWWNYTGSLDEGRISNVACSADWILTEYRNQSTPGTYISTGPRITPGAPGAGARHKVIGGA